MQQTILIVEDHAEIRAMMKIFISRLGYTVTEAGNGADAIQSVMQHGADLILLDIALPIVDGMGVAKAIRILEGHSKTPIIAVTAYSAYTQAAIDSGCNEVIQKPLHFQDIGPLLSQYLDNNKLSNN